MIALGVGTLLYIGVSSRQTAEYHDEITHKQTSLGIIGYGWNALRIAKAETISEL